MAFQGDSIFWVEVEKIVPNPFQPRREFDESKLKELSESVRMYGILQPLTVTRNEIQQEDGAFYTEYELIAGERRLRASKLAGLSQVPVIIREGENNEQEKLELAIIENLQREDLNAVDRALAFRQLADTFTLSHAQVAKKVGRSREYVSNTLRLLALPEYMLQSLKMADISEGHARTLLMLNQRPEEQDTVYREILLKKLSVREVERIARKIATEKVRKHKWVDTDPELIEIEKKFTETLGTRVQIHKTDFGGKLTIDYFSQEDLDKLLSLVKQEQADAATPMAVTAVAAVGDVVADIAETEDGVVEKLAVHTPLEAVEQVSPEVTPEHQDWPVEPPIEEVSPIAVVPEQEEVREESVAPFAQQNQPVVTPTEEVVQAEVMPEQAPIAEVPRMEVVSEEPKESVVEEAPTAQTQPAVSVAPMSLPEIPEVPKATTEDTPIAEQSFVPPESVKEQDDDESGLYSMKNFGI